MGKGCMLDLLFPCTFIWLDLVGCLLPLLHCLFPPEKDLSLKNKIHPDLRYYQLPKVIILHNLWLINWLYSTLTSSDDKVAGATIR